MLETNCESHREQHLDSAKVVPITSKTPTLLKEIKDAIAAYNGSLSSLSHKSGVDPKTIRKIANCEYKRAPNAETIQRLLSVISKQRSLVAIANYYGGEIEAYLKKALPQYFLKDATTEEENDESIKNEITDIYSYQLYKICVCFTEGIKKDKLISTLTTFITRTEKKLFYEMPTEEEVKAFRPLAILKIEQSIKTGLLKENRALGTIQCKYKNKWTPFEILQKYESHVLYFSEPEYWDNLDYFTYSIASACSKEEVNQISHILYNAYNKARSIVRNSKSQEIPINIFSSLESLQYHSKSEIK